MPRSLIPVTTLLVILLLTVGCGSPDGPVATAQPGASSSPSSPTSPEPTSSSEPSFPAPSASPSSEPSPSPAPTLSPAEADLLDTLRADASVDCAPRRTDLPPRAILGVECHPSDALVAAVGVYAFSDTGPDLEPALATYLERMAEAGVQPGMGDCANGSDGDHAWPANLPDEGDDEDGLRPTRSGCFINDDGIANVRLTCYGDIYMGVLGNTKELSALYAWAWKVADGDSIERDPPGLCARPD